MNPIKYRDFLPDESEPGFFGGVDFSSFDSTVAAMNQWLSENSVEVLRMETVVLPNIHNPGEGGPDDSELHSSKYVRWYQFVRLWYRESD